MKTEHLNGGTFLGSTQDARQITLDETPIGVAIIIKDSRGKPLEAISLTRDRAIWIADVIREMCGTLPRKITTPKVL